MKIQAFGYAHLAHYTVLFNQRPTKQVFNQQQPGRLLQQPYALRRIIKKK